MKREHNGWPAEQSITIDNDITLCTAIHIYGFRRGSIKMPASTMIGVLTLYGSHDGTNFGPCTDAAGNAETIVIGDASTIQLCSLPDEIKNFPMIKLVATATGTGTAQETATVWLTS